MKLEVGTEDFKAGEREDPIVHVVKKHTGSHGKTDETGQDWRKEDKKPLQISQV